MSRPSDDGSSPEPGAYEEPYETVVNGESFVVRQRTHEPGAYDFTWVSGPNPDYGFSSWSSDGSETPTAELDQAIREFLAMIDPATGYVGDAAEPELERWAQVARAGSRVFAGLWLLAAAVAAIVVFVFDGDDDAAMWPILGGTFAVGCTLAGLLWLVGEVRRGYRSGS